MPTPSAWYLRRVPPWAAMLSGLAVAVPLLLAAHRWDGMTAAALPAIALLGSVGAAFVHDDPALPVAGVTPRGTRWAPAHRYAAGLLPPVGALALLLMAPGAVDGLGWAVVVAGIATVVLVLATLLSLRQVPRPGAAVAGAAALLGLAPLTVGPMLDLPDVYPAPDLGPSAAAGWAALTVGSLTALALGRRAARR